MMASSDDLQFESSIIENDINDDDGDPHPQSLSGLSQSTEEDDDCGMSGLSSIESLFKEEDADGELSDDSEENKLMMSCCRYYGSDKKGSVMLKREERKETRRRRMRKEKKKKKKKKKEEEIIIPSLSVSPNWRISSPGDDPRDVKARLKIWAKAVAASASAKYYAT